MSYSLFLPKEPTKIVVPPLSLDATVGQSIVLPCEVSSDSFLSPIFKWFFNGKAIDFNRQDHFEMIGGVRHIYTVLVVQYDAGFLTLSLIKAHRSHACVKI